MKWRLYKLALLGCVAFGEASQACNVEDYDPSDVKGTDVVVVGRIGNYRLIPNQGYAESARNGTDPVVVQGPPPVVSGVLPGRYYGKFDVVVDKVMKGRVHRKFSATCRPWAPCCFGPNVKEVLPNQLESRRYLMALDDPPARSPFAHSADLSLPTMHIDICIGAFLMKMPDAAWFEKEVEKYLAQQRFKLLRR